MSRITFTVSTVPARAKSSWSSASPVSYGRFPTYNFRLMNSLLCRHWRPSAPPMGDAGTPRSSWTSRMDFVSWPSRSSGGASQRLVTPKGSAATRQDPHLQCYHDWPRVAAPPGMSRALPLSDGLLHALGLLAEPFRIARRGIEYRRCL